ncbi:MAG: PP2C family serine/threonine-protein phosphatase [Oscillospiraceae bacterium]|nr:serine/threonine-protein phosphatase [Oscillospiraceae bacterium]MDY2847440.1 PP2C family serine/threonine-protein phosphatase [Oscillospiraceae bacterium]
MIFDTSKYTNPGGREINEDSMLCKNGVWIVADGLGGHADGEKASAEAIRYFEENCCGDYTEQRVNELLEGANAAVCRLNGPGRSTAAAAFAENGVFRMANVGDSRVYYFRDGKIIAQTKDHSVCQASVDMGMMTADEIRSSEDRSGLLKVLGNENSLNIKKPYPPIDIQSGDAFLVCSDGFWEYVLESEMEADLLKSDSADTWMSHMLKRHLIRAQNHGDNYTVICGFIYRDASDTASEAPVPKVRPSVIIIAAAVVLFAAAMGAIALLSSEINAPVTDADTTEIASVTETAAVMEETSETDISESESEESSEETEETSETEVTESETEETESESTVTEVPETESEAAETVTKDSDTTDATTTTAPETTTTTTTTTTTKAPETTPETSVPSEAEVTKAPGTTTKERKSETETESGTVTTATPWSCDTSPVSSETETEETTSKTTAPNKQTETESTRSDADESSSESSTKDDGSRK